MNRVIKAIVVLFSAVVFGACNVNLSTGGKTVQSGWETFKSDQYGYSIQHPKGWTVKDNSTENSRQIYVYEPNKRAYLKIDAYSDDRINSTETMKSAVSSFKQRMEEEPDLTVKEFKESIEGEVGGYIATGEQKIGDEVYLFENRGLVSANGRMLIFHRTVIKDAFAELDETLSKIIKSFSIGN